VDATKPPGPIVQLVSGHLISALQDCLAAARGKGAPGASNALAKHPADPPP
jgi:hypothetical protein